MFLILDVFDQYSLGTAAIPKICWTGQGTLYIIAAVTNIIYSGLALL